MTAAAPRCYFAAMATGRTHTHEHGVTHGATGKAVIRAGSGNFALLSRIRGEFAKTEIGEFAALNSAVPVARRTRARKTAGVSRAYKIRYTEHRPTVSVTVTRQRHPTESDTLRCCAKTSSRPEPWSGFEASRLSRPRRSWSTRNYMKTSDLNGGCGRQTVTARRRRENGGRKGEGR